MFITHDTITEPLFMAQGLEGMTLRDEEGPATTLQNFVIYSQAVDRLKQSTGTTRYDYQVGLELGKLSSGPVCQPNSVHAFISKDNWKLVRYFDPLGNEADQHELYDLNRDPNELVNLVKYNADRFPKPMDVDGYSEQDIRKKACKLMRQLKKSERRMLSWKENRAEPQ